MKNKYGIYKYLLLATVPVIGIIILYGPGFTQDCDKFVSNVIDINKAQHIEKKIIDIINNEKNLVIIANAGGEIYSHETPFLFSKLSINYDYKKLGIYSDDKYIKIGGDWWNGSGSIDINKISYISIGESPRRYIKIGLNEYELGENNDSRLSDGVTYINNKLAVYCK
jgi:hypothetical protein